MERNFRGVSHDGHFIALFKWGMGKVGFKLCQVRNCCAPATMISPADLCDEHWEMWFKGNITDFGAAMETLLWGVEIPEYDPH